MVRGVTASHRSLSRLRRRAEEALAPESPAQPGQDDSLARLVHELQVHQVELELQNEELRETQIRAEEASERYLQLYDSAPVGYFTLDPQSRILQVNLAGADLLGIERQLLANRPFSDFVAPDDQDAFYLHRQRMQRAGGRGACELRLLGTDDKPTVVRMEWAAYIPTRGAKRHCRVVVMDVTDLRHAQEALFRAHHELERRVGERTRDLKAANERLQLEIEERRDLEREILQIVTRERMRITRELHDGLCQLLFGIRMLTQSARQKAGIASPLAADLDLVSQCAEEAEQTARNISSGLCPVLASGDGLAAAVQHLAEESSRLLAVRCSVSVRGPLNHINTEAVYNLHAIAREAIRNAVRHGKATWVRVGVRGSKTAVSLSIHDNGSGMPAQPRNDGLGLRLMHHQADLMDGQLSIVSRPGAGTTVLCRIPLRRHPLPARPRAGA